MTRNPLSSRRAFLTSSAGLAAAGLCGDFRFLARLPAAGLDETVPTGRVLLDPSIEPLVRLLEETPQERLLEEVGMRLRRGDVGYRELLGALQLAGVRNIQPRPVGFKFHAVLVVHSAHLASMAASGPDRWLPLFWALDHFKDSQRRDVEQGDWTMGPLGGSPVPAGGGAVAAFRQAMDNWDEGAADVATAGLARSVGAHRVFDLLALYGARDFRDIGHKAIFVANAWRTLGTIGWEHAEPILRSVAYALLMHEGENPAGRETELDQPGRVHLRQAGELPADWVSGRRDAAAAGEFLALLREATWQEASSEAIRLLRSGIGPDTLWDAQFAFAGELLMRRPGIISLHAVTSANALHYAFRQASDDLTRRFLLLQGVAFLPFFRQDPSGLAEKTERIDALAPWEPEPDELAGAFAAVNRDRYEAARRVLGWCERQGRPGAEALIREARRMLFLKGSNAHDYKFTSAVLEDYGTLAPGLRDRFLATSVYNLRGTGEPDNPLVERIRSALA